MSSDGRAFDELVHTILKGPDSTAIEYIRSRTNVFPFRRAEIESYLSSDSKLRRLNGIARACVEHGSAGNPLLAEGLGRALLATLRAGDPELSTDEQHYLRMPTAFALGQSLLRQGKFDDVCENSDIWLANWRGRSPRYDGAFIVQKASALALQLQISEARAILATLTEQERKDAIGLDSTEKLIEKYEIRPRLSVEPFDRSLAIRRVFDETELLKENVENWERELRVVVAGTEFEAETLRDLATLRRIQAELHALQTRNDNAAVAEEGHRKLHEFQTAARRLLYGAQAQVPLEMHQVVENISYAAMVDSFAQPNDEEIADAIDRAGASLEWSARTNALHHKLDAQYVLTRLHRRRPDGADAAFRIGRTMLRDLLLVRTGGSDTETRLSYTGSHRGFLPYMMKAGIARQDFALCFEVSEFRKGLMDLRAGAESGRNRVLMPQGAQALGPRTHYASFSAFDENEPVTFSMYLASGMFEALELDVTPGDIRAHADRLDPVEWRSRRRFGKTAHASPGETFVRLMAGFQSAMNRGVVHSGDHVVIAAEDPIHPVPLHLLLIGAEPACANLSMSRSASFADAFDTYRSAFVEIRTAAAVFVPADGEADRAEKKAAFDLVAQDIRAQEVLSGDQATVAAVARLLQRHELIHLQAHGQYARRGQNPLETAGVRLSGAAGLPRRAVEAEALLSPLAILDGPDLCIGGHVSLLACVTGLAKRGEGGDNLGLEIALRMKGISSVIASHWDIEWRSANAFLSTFYDCWLAKRMTRAKAWQRANEAARSSDSSGRSLGSAFSLYGDWR